MSDIVARTRVAPPAAESTTPQVEVDKSRHLETEVEPPYTDYHQQKGRSYILDMYEVGELIDPRTFETEVGDIEAYLEHQISSGEVNNTTESVKNEIKRIEKLVNVKKDARVSMRLALVAEYAKFLLKAEGIKRESAKYGLI